MKLARLVRINLVSIRLNMALIEEVIGMGAGDVGELYSALADRLEQIVRLDVRASDAVIEDACQVAWVRLLHHRQRVHRETVMALARADGGREAVGCCAGTGASLARGGVEAGRPMMSSGRPR